MANSNYPDPDYDAYGNPRRNLADNEPADKGLPTNVHPIHDNSARRRVAMGLLHAQPGRLIPGNICDRLFPARQRDPGFLSRKG